MPPFSSCISSSIKVFSIQIPDGFLLKCKYIHIACIFKILQSFLFVPRIKFKLHGESCMTQVSFSHHPIILYSPFSVNISVTLGAVLALASGLPWCSPLFLDCSPSPPPLTHPFVFCLTLSCHLNLSLNLTSGSKLLLSPHANLCHPMKGVKTPCMPTHIKLSPLRKRNTETLPTTTTL